MGADRPVLSSHTQRDVWGGGLREVEGVEIMMKEGLRTNAKFFGHSEASDSCVEYVF